MNLLLDTHIWLNAHLAPKRLSQRVRRELSSSKNTLWLSPLSVWETLLLVEKGRIKLDRPATQWIAESLRVSPMQEASLTFEVALASDSVVLPHGDPVDRQLVATARAYSLTLVTSDENIIDAGAVPVLANL